MYLVTFCLQLFNIHCLFTMASQFNANESFDPMSENLERKLEKYDVKLRPGFGGPPLLVDIEVIVSSVNYISEVNMDFTITAYLNQFWRDERLQFADQTLHLTMAGDFVKRIWMPDTCVANDKYSYLHDVTERNTVLRIRGDGSVTYGMRLTMTLSCMMDLHYYPLDEQNCTVEIESYGYPVEDLLMRWKNVSALHGWERLEMPQFTLVAIDRVERIARTETGSYQRLSLSFLICRNIGYFFFQTYLPSIFIVMLSWISFWINYEATSARVTFGITTVLTMTTISTGVRSTLPRISYVKAIDVYLMVCFVFVFAALLEYAAVNYTYWSVRTRLKLREYERSRRNSERKASGSGSSTQISTPTRLSPLVNFGSQSVATIANSNGKGAYDLKTGNGRPCQRIAKPITYSYHGYGGYLVNRQRLLASLRRRRGLVGRLRTFLAKSEKEKADGRLKRFDIDDVRKVDQFARVVFPIAFLLFNLSYWSFYGLASNLSRTIQRADFLQTH